MEKNRTGASLRGLLVVALTGTLTARAAGPADDAAAAHVSRTASPVAAEPAGGPGNAGSALRPERPPTSGPARKPAQQRSPGLANALVTTAVTQAPLPPSPPPPPVLPPGRSGEEMEELRAKARAGDGRAAYILSYEYSLCRRNEAAGQRWLRRAVELGHPAAEESFAYQLRKESGTSWIGFGLSRRHAVKSLLERASRTEESACYTLAELYEEGYFGKPDLVRARSYLQRSSDLGDSVAWEKLARYCQEGIGGEQDPRAAYWWRSLKTVGNDVEVRWTEREEAARHLTLPELQEAWARLDARVPEIYGKEEERGAVIDPETRTKHRRLYRLREQEHRNARTRALSSGPSQDRP